MRNSPLQIGRIFYTEVSVRAQPGMEPEKLEEPLPVQVEAEVLFEADGENFAVVRLKQLGEEWPYIVNVSVMASFRLDPEGCRAAYKNQFNPAVIAVNVARVLFSSARETISTVSARGPYDVANVPTLILEPDDVSLAFNGDEHAILRSQFGMSDEDLARLEERKALAAQGQVPPSTKKRKSSK